MSSEIVKSVNDDDPPANLLEVDFALVLARMVDTVKADPSQMRNIVYELARAKLRQEITWADPDEEVRHIRALETAIRGVEDFSRRQDQSKALSDLSSPTQAASISLHQGVLRPPDPPTLVDQGNTISDTLTSVREPQFGRTRTKSFRSVWIRAGAGFAILALFAVLTKNYLPFNLPNKLIMTSQKIPQEDRSNISGNGPAVQGGGTSVAQTPAIPLPAVYGVYALDDGKLAELSELSERVTDKRIAISTPINSPSKSLLADGRIKFVVFRRDLAAYAPSTADIRVIARVTRVTSFDSNGKPKIAPLDGVWSMRSTSFQYRVAPLAGNPEMFVVQPQDPNFELPAGRYALALNGQGYDFVVAGAITEKSQCLERVDAANGSFYSECKN
jgi:hypothetical protein